MDASLNSSQEFLEFKSPSQSIARYVLSIYGSLCTRVYSIYVTAGVWGFELILIQVSNPQYKILMSMCRLIRITLALSKWSPYSTFFIFLPSFILVFSSYPGRDGHDPQWLYPTPLIVLVIGKCILPR